jgi:glycosyltransferase involved in cell wall biosynthesis
MKRLLTIGHSYVVGANRRLAQEMALQGAGQWSVTTVAPRRFRGDLGRISATHMDDEAGTLQTLRVRFDRSPHLMWYSGLRAVLDAPWDVIHCWEEPYVLAGAQVARGARPSARLAVATFQNIQKRYPWPFSAFERMTMARADGWIAFGDTIQKTLAARRGYADKPYRVISPGVDLARFRPDAAGRRQIRDRLGWTSSDRVVGFLGRFVPEKGISLMLQALRNATAPWRALFVGGGPLQGDLERFAQEFPGRVHIANGVAHDEVPAWLNAMTLLCAPSQTTASWREQFGRMLIEAMACGIPVVASDSGEMPSVVGEAGVVLPERDVPAWTQAIDRLLGSDAILSDHAARGVERANARFGWPIVARAHLSFFETLMEGGRA